MSASESRYRRVIITQVDTIAQIATCVNLTTGGEFDMPTTTTGYDRPRPGDAWLCAIDRGIWTFMYLLESQVSVTQVATAEHVMFELSERGSMPWAGMESTVPEVPFWSCIGDRRLFQIKPSLTDRWLPMNGAVKSRSRWPALYLVMAIGGWAIDDTLFVVPYVQGVDSASWFICGA